MSSRPQNTDAGRVTPAAVGKKRLLESLLKRAEQVREQNPDLEGELSDEQLKYVGYRQRGAGPSLALAAVKVDEFRAQGQAYSTINSLAKQMEDRVGLIANYPIQPEVRSAEEIRGEKAREWRESTAMPLERTMSGVDIRAAEVLLGQILDGTHPDLKLLSPDKALALRVSVAQAEKARYAEPSEVVRGVVKAKRDIHSAERGEERVAKWVDDAPDKADDDGENAASAEVGVASPAPKGNGYHFRVPRGSMSRATFREGGKTDINGAPSLVNDESGAAPPGESDGGITGRDAVAAGLGFAVGVGMGGGA